MTGNITYLDESAAAGWERTLYAFLAEKERRSGSKRTVQSYSRMLHDFFGRTGKTPDEVTSADVFAWGYGRGSPAASRPRSPLAPALACLSSFYRFLIRMSIVTSNPCDALERPKVTQSTPRGLSAEQIRRLLTVVPRTPVGLRDRAIILTLVMTGRRRAEVLGMTAGSINVEDRVYYTYRGKGGKAGKRELPQPAYDAITGWLAASGRSLAIMAPDASLWPDTRTGRGITSGTFYTNLRRYLKQARLAARRRAHLPPQRGQAQAGCGRVDRGGVAVPGPQQPGGDDDVPAAAGGAGGQELGEGGGCDWSSKPYDLAVESNICPQSLSEVVTMPAPAVCTCRAPRFGIDDGSERCFYCGKLSKNGPSATTQSRLRPPLISTPVQVSVAMLDAKEQGQRLRPR